MTSTDTTASWTPRVARVARAVVESVGEDERRAKAVAIVSRELQPETGREDGAQVYSIDSSTRLLKVEGGGGAPEGFPPEPPVDGEHAFARGASPRRAVIDGTQVGMPLTLGDELVGVLALILARPGAIAPADLDPLQAIGDVLSL